MVDSTRSCTACELAPSFFFPKLPNMRKERDEQSYRIKLPQSLMQSNWERVCLAYKGEKNKPK